jgi:hypothetical protein
MFIYQSIEKSKMKEWRRFLQRLFIRHVAAFPEELCPHWPNNPAPDPVVLRASLSRYYRWARPSQYYRLVYDPVYFILLDDLKQEGWFVQLQAEQHGGLTYRLIPPAAVTEII